MARLLLTLVLFIFASAVNADYKVRLLGSSEKTLIKLAESLDSEKFASKVSLDFVGSGLGRVSGQYEVRKSHDMLLLNEVRGTEQLNQRYLSGAVFKEGDYVVVNLYVQHEGPTGTRHYKSVVKIRGDKVLTARTFSRPASSVSGKTCGNGSASALESTSNVVSGEVAPQTSAATTYRILEVVTSKDSSFSNQVSSADSQIVSLVNAASEIYKSQLGIEIRVASQISYNGTSNNSSSLLNSWREYTNSNGLLSGSADAAFLFSGEDFDGPSGSTIGLAYLGVTCAYPTYAQGIVQHVANSLDHIIFAHELGHNLNADHSTSGSIMGSSLGNPVPTSFSSGSISTITSWVSTEGSCMPSGESNGGGGGGASPTATPTPNNNGGGGGNTSPTATPVPPTPSEITLDNVRISGGKTIKGTIVVPAGASESCEVNLWGGKSSTVYTKILKTTDLTKTTFEFSATVSKKPNKDIHIVAELACDGVSEENYPISSSKRIRAKSFTKVSPKIGQTTFFSHLASKLKFQ